MKPADDDTNFLRKVSEKANRKLKAQREGDPHVWMGLEVLGLVGWSVVVPVLIGLVGGWWLDQCCPGKYIWSLNLLMAGLFLGCLNVCRWLRKEYRAMRDDKEQKHD